MGNIIVAENTATVNGDSVSVIGSGNASGDVWTFDDPIDLFSFDGPIEIIIDFDDAAAPTESFAISTAAGNLGDIFSSFILVVDETTGVVTLTVDSENLVQGVIQGGAQATFQVNSPIDLSGGDDVIINFICFAQGTLIDTSAGPIPVENLSTGDLITTMDNGPKALRWVGARTLNTAALTRNPHLRPITIQANALGPQNPTTDLTVSPQHRILLNTPNVQLNFWLEAALAPAKGLVDNDKVTISAQDSVTYYHLLFDRHEIIRSNGTWTESLFPGKQSMLALDAAARAEVLELFPELALQDAGIPPAAPFLSVKETSVLAGQAGQQCDGTSQRGTN